VQDPSLQKKLSQEQIGEFYHDLFVTSQVEHFHSICLPFLAKVDQCVVDMGGGCGFFALGLARAIGLRCRVIDLDPVSIDRCHESGVDAIQGDALRPPRIGDEGFVCFNLILHHLVGADEKATRKLQGGALDAWHKRSVPLFVNEYIYDSHVATVSGKLIYAITKSHILSFIGRSVARLVPSLKANTFGVGVRFRAADEWRNFFREHGWDVVAYKKGLEEEVSFARRLLLIKSCRRDSFVLREIQHSV
jgi:hypothetical protein